MRRLLDRSYPVSVVNPDGATTGMRMVARYDIDDPAAITLLFPDHGYGDVTWTFARSLLLTALVPGLVGSWRGDGDVRVIYCGPIAAIDLRSPDGKATVFLAGPALTDLAAATIRLCAPRSEQESLPYQRQLDRDLRSALGGAA